MRCTCGFTELDDEKITDHFHLVFEPDDHRGKDGLVHEEGNPLACLCGFNANSPDELDAHLLTAFIPDDAIGRDGRRHEPAEIAGGKLAVEGAELGELIARRLAAIMEPTWDELLAKMNAILARCEEIKGKLLRIEQHYKTCPTVQAQEAIQ
jgi:hypothetical protein